MPGGVGLDDVLDVVRLEGLFEAPPRRHVLELHAGITEVSKGRGRQRQVVSYNVGNVSRPKPEAKRLRNWCRMIKSSVINRALTLTAHGFTNEQYIMELMSEHGIINLSTRGIR